MWFYLVKLTAHLGSFPSRHCPNPDLLSFNMAVALDHPLESITLCWIGALSCRNGPKFARANAASKKTWLERQRKGIPFISIFFGQAIKFPSINLYVKLSREKKKNMSERLGAAPFRPGCYGPGRHVGLSAHRYGNWTIESERSGVGQWCNPDGHFPSRDVRVPKTT